MAAQPGSMFALWQPKVHSWHDPGPRMTAAYALKRIAMALPTLLLVALAVFGLLRLVPGDPAQLMLGDAADAAQLAALRESMGLHQSIPVQFARWLGAALSGDLGQSLANGQAVLPLILERFAVTATVVLPAVALAAVVAVPLGTIAAWKQNGTLDLAVVGGATLLLSIPSFWLGLLLLMLFGLRLGWVPVVGYVGFGEDPWGALLYIALPIVTLTLIEAGVLTRMARAAAIDVLRLEYVAHARSKGLRESSVLARHVLPNAFAPTLTLLGIVLGNLLGGIAVIETVFTIPGLGRLLVDGIFARDYPVVQGTMLFVAAIYVVVNLITDLLYPFFDPRVAAE
jgi:peptide/nickel transport system permease protein